MQHPTDSTAPVVLPARDPALTLPEAAVARRHPPPTPVPLPGPPCLYLGGPEEPRQLNRAALPPPAPGVLRAIRNALASWLSLRLTSFALAVLRAAARLRGLA